MKKVLFLLMFSTFLIMGCSSNTDISVSSNEENGEWPEILKMGSLLTEDSEITRVNDEFATDLGEYLGIPVEIFNGEDYNSMIEAMRTENIDITNYGPFGYIIAAERSGAIPIAIMAADEENTFYSSTFVVPADSEAQSLTDLEGKDLLFVDPASTSGHLFPRATMIRELGIENDDVEKYFNSVAFSGGHDKSLLAVANGDVDVAAVGGDLVIDMFSQSGLFNKEDIRVISKSDPIPNAPLTYRKGLPEDLVKKIKEFALDYHKTNPDYFTSQGATAYYPVDDSAYDVVRETAKLLDMSPEELLE